jgi:uncharacterized protein (TIGR02145 family)
VLIENLTQGGDTVLYFPDTVLTIDISGIDPVSGGKNGFAVSQNYPNPFETKTNVDVFMPERGDLSLNVYDISGRKIADYKATHRRGMQHFTFFAGNAKSYILSVCSGKYLQHIQMIQFGEAGSASPHIEHHGSTTTKEPEIKQKSLRSYFDYEQGDELKFTAYISVDHVSITDTPSGSEVYFFDINNVSPSTPTAGTHVSNETEIEWNWNTVSDADGYAYNTTDDYSTATDNGTNTSFTQTGLTCETSYTLYVWAYNAWCESDALELTENTGDCQPFECGTMLIDTRDGSGYQTIQIGSQCWMAENLNYEDNVNGHSWCYDDSPSNCDTYGRLYDWEASMEGAAGSTSSPSGVQGICPDGWHIPSDEEWKELEGEVDAVYNYGDEEWDIAGFRGEDAGSALAGNASLWNNGGLKNHASFGNSGFGSLPGGRKSSSGEFTGLGNYAYFWSTTEDNVFPGYAFYHGMHYDNVKASRYNENKGNALNVRCIKD